MQQTLKYLKSCLRFITLVYPPLAKGVRVKIDVILVRQDA